MTTYSNSDTQSGQASFQVPYRVARLGDRFRLKVKPHVPLDELRLEVDRDHNGT